MSTQEALARCRKALEDICNPIAAMQRDMQEGYQLNGAMALHLANNPETARKIAREVLAATAQDKVSMEDAGPARHSDAEQIASLILDDPDGGRMRVSSDVTVESDNAMRFTVTNPETGRRFGVYLGMAELTSDAALPPEQPEKADAELLDWLDVHPHAVTYSQGYLGSANSWAWRDRNKASHDAASLRAAIRAAIASQSQEPT